MAIKGNYAQSTSTDPQSNPSQPRGTDDDSDDDLGLNGGTNDESGSFELSTGAPPPPPTLHRKINTCIDSIAHPTTPGRERPSYGKHGKQGKHVLQSFGNEGRPVP